MQLIGPLYGQHLKIKHLKICFQEPSLASLLSLFPLFGNFPTGSGWIQAMGEFVGFRSHEKATMLTVHQATQGIGWMFMLDSFETCLFHSIFFVMFFKFQISSNYIYLSLMEVGSSRFEEQVSKNAMTPMNSFLVCFCVQSNTHWITRFWILLERYWLISRKTWRAFDLNLFFWTPGGVNLKRNLPQSGLWMRMNLLRGVDVALNHRLTGVFLDP